MITAPIYKARPDVISLPLLSLTSTATLRSDLNAYVGFRIDVPNAGIWVTHLARYVISGNTGAHTVKIVNSSNVTQTSISIATSGKAEGFWYEPITPYLLPGNATYYLLSQEFSGGDQWYDEAIIVPAGVVSYYGRAFDLGGGLNFSGTQENISYVPVNLKYRS